MKNYKLILILLFSIVGFVSCKDKATSTNEDISEAYQCPMKCEGEKAFPSSGSCSVCNMDLKPIEKTLTKGNETDKIHEESIFNLTTKWHTEENKTIELKQLKGKTLVMVMIYTTCKAACPRLVADMRNIEAKIPDKQLEQLQFVLVSIDPETDTPTRLKAFAKENYMDDAHWTFLQGTENSVREFANVLAVKYKQITPMDFSHSNIITVFNADGVMAHQQEGLGVDNKETVETILRLIN